MYRIVPVLILALAAVAGCSSAYGGFPSPGGPLGDVVVVDDGARGANAARGLRVPPGHYPPPGECRVWYPGRPPGQQPPPARCEALVGRVPFGAFVLYNGKEWDTRYDWREHERAQRGSVPSIILDLMASLAR